MNYLKNLLNKIVLKAGFDLDEILNEYQSGKLSQQDLKDKLIKIVKTTEITNEDTRILEYDFKVGQEYNLKKLILNQKFTKPPSRFSAASLIKKLEELGIGRPSTYASIISTLEDRGYLESGVRNMQPSPLGLQVNKLLSENFEKVTNSQLTAQMEDNLDMISRGESTYEGVLSDFWFDFKNEVEEIAPKLVEKRQDYREIETDVKCPTCSSDMTLRLGRFGPYFQCSSVHEHQFPKNFKEYEIELKKAQENFNYLTKDKKCEVCQKDLIVRVSKASLKSYIACPDYRVGNNHTILNIAQLTGEKPAKKYPSKPKTTKSNSKTVTKTKTKIKSKSKPTLKSKSTKSKPKV
jgi:ssDNA-binding Zn-finger/Zn-ribbon topoisomerase 1